VWWFCAWSIYVNSPTSDINIGVEVDAGCGVDIGAGIAA
jgi:hypothetical protein